MTTFSVVICTYNRPNMLTMALNALINRTDEKPDQVVIVNGGDERSDAIVQNYQNNSNIRIELINTVNKNLATSRNLGLAHCTGDIVAMTDDDAEVFPDWITQIKKVLDRHPEAGAVGGAVLGADSDKHPLSRIADATVFPSPSVPSYVRTLPGVNIAYRKTVLAQVGFQDETLFRGEDVDFNWRIKLLGYEIYYSPEIRVLHYHRPTLRLFINQFYMYGRAYYLVRTKWPEMYCLYPHKLHRIKDFLKVLNFFGSVFYLPIITASHMSKWLDRIQAVPILIATEIAWKSGVICQKCLSLQTRRNL